MRFYSHNDILFSFKRFNGSDEKFAQKFVCCIFAKLTSQLKLKFAFKFPPLQQIQYSRDKLILSYH